MQYVQLVEYKPHFAIQLSDDVNDILKKVKNMVGTVNNNNRRIFALDPLEQFANLILSRLEDNGFVLIEMKRYHSCVIATMVFEEKILVKFSISSDPSNSSQYNIAPGPPLLFTIEDSESILNNIFEWGMAESFDQFDQIKKIMEDIILKNNPEPLWTRERIESLILSRDFNLL